MARIWRRQPWHPGAKKGKGKAKKREQKRQARNWRENLMGHNAVDLDLGLLGLSHLNRPQTSRAGYSYMEMPPVIDLEAIFDLEEEQEEAGTEILFGSLRGNIVGIQYYKGTVNNQEMVSLVREPKNPYDPNAVKVTNVDGVQVGHIKRELARALSKVIDLDLARVEGTVPFGATNVYSMPVDLSLWGKAENKDSAISKMKSSGFLLKEPEQPGIAAGYNQDLATTRVLLSPLQMMGELDKLFENLKEGDKTSQATPAKAVSTPLYLHQKQALFWMMERENKNILPPFWEKRGNQFFNTITVFSTNRKPKSVHGGILADDMGLGKTLEMIALIMTNFENGKPLAVPLEGVVRPTKKIFKKQQSVTSNGPKKKIDVKKKLQNSSVGESSLTLDLPPLPCLDPTLTTKQVNLKKKLKKEPKEDLEEEELDEEDSNDEVDGHIAENVMVKAEDPDFVADIPVTPSSALAASPNIRSRPRRASRKPAKYCYSDQSDNEEDHPGGKKCSGEIIQPTSDSKKFKSDPSTKLDIKPEPGGRKGGKRGKGGGKGRGKKGGNFVKPETVKMEQETVEEKLPLCDNSQTSNSVQDVNTVTTQKAVGNGTENVSCAASRLEQNSNCDSKPVTTKLPNGIIQHVHSDGTVETIFPSGIVQKILPDGTVTTETPTRGTQTILPGDENPQMSVDHVLPAKKATPPEKTESPSISLEGGATEVISNNPGRIDSVPMEVGAANETCTQDVVSMDIGAIAEISNKVCLPSTSKSPDPSVVVFPNENKDIDVTDVVQVPSTNSVPASGNLNDNHIIKPEIVKDKTVVMETKQISDKYSTTDSLHQKSSDSPINPDSLHQKSSDSTIVDKQPVAQTVSILPKAVKSKSCPLLSTSATGRSSPVPSCSNSLPDVIELPDLSIDSTDLQTVYVDLVDDDLPDLQVVEVSTTASQPPVQGNLDVSACGKLSGRTISTGPRGTLIICPLSVMSNWINQFDIHIHEGVCLEVYMYYGADRIKEKEFLENQDIVLTTYSTVAMDAKGSHPLKSVEWLRIVLDEGHNIRNPRAQQTKAILELKAKRKWVLTGTPIQNSMKDLWSLVNFLHVSPFTDKQWWNRTIERPLANGEQKALKRVRHLMAMIAMRRTKTMMVDGKPLVELPQKNVFVEEITLGEDERKVYDAMQNSGQLVICKYFNQGTLLHHYGEILAILMRLRQLCCHPLLVAKAAAMAKMIEVTNQSAAQAPIDETNEEQRKQLVQTLLDVLQSGSDEECSICLDSLKQAVITPCAHVYCRVCIEAVIRNEEPHSKCPLCRGELKKEHLVAVPEETTTTQTFTDADWQSSAKVDALLNRLINLRQQDPSAKSLVVSQFTSLLNLLEIPLRKRGFTFTRLDGTMSAQQRDRSIHDFSETGPETPSILLLSLKAGGVGLNLTAANNVFLMDPAWNPASEEQCFDRCHRLGQTKEVTVTKFVITDSVEERMLELQEKKRQLMKGAFDKKPNAEQRRQQRINDLRTLINL